MPQRKVEPGSASDRLVERGAELAEIDQGVAAAVSGGGSLLVLTGPAGIGKSALVDAGRERAEHAGALVMTARASEYEGGHPYGVVRQLLEPVLRKATPAARARYLGGAAANAGPVVLGSQTVGTNLVDQTFAVSHGLYWLVANMASETPVALLVDDIHWSDAPSLRFLFYLARRLDGLAAMVIASIRTGEAGSDEALIGLGANPDVRLLAPEALSDDGVAAVLSSVFDQAPDAAFVRSCAEVTGGNPFFVRELGVALKLDGIQPLAESTMQFSRAAPPTISRAALAHLGRLSDDAAAMARSIAVLGSDATMPRAAVLAELEEGRALDALDALLAAEVVRTTNGLEFCHPIMHNAVYGELAPGARSATHRRAASLLAAEAADLDAIAGHLVASQPIGDLDTVATLREAATRSLAAGASDTAVAYLERALEENPERELRAAVLLELGLAEMVLNQPGAAEHFDQVCRVTTDPATRARALIEQAGIAVWQEGNWPHALVLLESALADLVDGPQDLRMQAEAMYATRTMYDSNLVGAFVERLPIFEELVAAGGTGTRPLTLLLAAWGAQHDATPEQVKRLVELGWDGGRYLDDGDSLELLPQGLCALVYCDDLDGAEAILAMVRSAAETSSSAMQFLIAEAHDAWLHTWIGDLTAAAAEMRGTIERALEVNLHFAVLSTLWYCADVLLERPDVADLGALLEAIEPGPLGEISGGAMFIQARGLLRFAAGNREGAMADLRYAGSVTTRLGFGNSFACAWRSMLALMLDSSDRPEALALVKGELDDAIERDDARRIGVALRASGMLEPDREAGLLRLEEAVNVLAGTSARLEHARALVEFGAALRRAGQASAARLPLRNGLDLATTCGAIRLAERARVELAASGARPRRDRITGRYASTPAQLRVALMAANGHSNQEIAQLLFVTTRTVEAHIYTIYSKLGINSRRQLAEALIAQPQE